MDLVAYGGAALGIILSVLEYRAGAVTFAECFFIIMISAEFFLPLRLLGSFFHIAMNGNAAADKIFRFLDTPVPVSYTHLVDIGRLKEALMELAEQIEGKYPMSLDTKTGLVMHIACADVYKRQCLLWNVKCQL